MQAKHPVDVAMDESTNSHLLAWVQKHEQKERQFITYWAIVDFCREYPDLPSSRSWPEILSLAERQL